MNKCTNDENHKWLWNKDSGLRICWFCGLRQRKKWEYADFEDWSK